MLPATDARVFKIAGGNELLPQALLDAARVHLKLGWTVNEVRRLAARRNWDLRCRRLQQLHHRTLPRCSGMTAVLTLQIRATKSKGYELHARRAKSAVQKRRHGRWQQVRVAPAALEPRLLGHPEGARPMADGVGPVALVLVGDRLRWLLLM